MGIRNVNAAFTYWTHLPDRPFRVLIRMCQIANDDTRTYYGGQEMLAQGLGLTFPNLPHDDEASPEEREKIREERDAAFRKVRRALQVLTDAGVVSLLNVPRVGSRANYSVNAHTPPEQVTQRPPHVDNADGEQVTQRPTEQVTQRPPSRSLDDRGAGHSVTPQPLRNQDEPEPHQEISSTHSTPDRAREDKPMNDAPTLDHFKAQAILDAAAKTGTDVVALMALAPKDCTTKGQRRIWAAQQLATKEAS